MKLEFPKVLLIDDDEPFSKALVRWLSELGYRPSIAPTAVEGIALLEQGGFEALLLDLQLPDGSGHAILRQLHRVGMRVPVIVVSGTAEMDDVVRVWHENAADFLRKPFRIEDLAASLDRALGRALRENPSESRPSLATAPVAPAPARAQPDADAERRSHLEVTAAAQGSTAGAKDLRSAPSALRGTAVPRGGPGTPAAAATAGAAPIPHLRPAASKLLERLKAGTVRLPILDPRVARLPELLRSDNWTLEDLVNTVTRDGGLAAGILRSANSAVLARGKELTSLRDACTRLGSRAVIAIAFEITVKGQFAAPSEPFRSILKSSWRNAIVASRVAPALGEMLRVAEPDELRLMALFHNVGELLCVCLLPGMQGQSASTVTLEQLAAEIEGMHEELGAILATSWKLPPSVLRMAGHHHRPAQHPEPKDQSTSRNLVLASWAIALRAGFTYLPGQEAVDPGEFLNELGLTQQHVSHVYDAIKTWSVET
ncbi:MAG: response regulator [Nitrospirae bacterium]|nr:MAG: response regulator [Nitrospirota bacterium]